MPSKRKVALLMAALFLAAVVCGVDRFLRAPLNQSGSAITYTLKPGTSLKVMLRQLQAQGVVNGLQAQLLSGWIQGRGWQRALQAGEYQLPFNITPQRLLHKLITGEVIQHAITFPEGSTFAEVMSLIAKHPAVLHTLTGKSNLEVMALLGAAHPPEGWFFPDTYHFTAGMTDLALLRRAYQTMQQRLQWAWEQRDPAQTLQTAYEALVLASIVEKEAAIQGERCLIAGVFQRRLRQKMRLQADPTVAYGLDLALRVKLTRENLKQATPYNTYVHGGLPPTPIASPGMAAIEAALHPDPGWAPYFVAKGDGTHYFSHTLQEHNAAVMQYQREKREHE